MATDDAKIVGSILVFLALALLFVYLFLEKKYESFERDQLRSDEEPSPAPAAAPPPIDTNIPGTPIVSPATSDSRTPHEIAKSLSGLKGSSIMHPPLPPHIEAEMHSTSLQPKKSPSESLCPKPLPSLVK
eukprot:TRINITY_DN37205_c0_g1_i1.p1 TRINITY_DN37205_c0_g1~~TRINITY_DN37205_c0_g1_i1.p1  ORF type:complete len:130 (-),score=9.59 TRINITY_DN37205_c0_g1_i1:51-440(-)